MFFFLHHPVFWMLTGNIWKVLVSGHALGKFPKLRRASLLTVLTWQGKGLRKLSSCSLMEVHIVSHGVLTLTASQNKQPQLHSSWSGGICVCAQILQDEWLWAVSKESKAQRSKVKPWTCSEWCRTEMVCAGGEDRWGAGDRQLGVQNGTCDGCGCSPHHLWLSGVQRTLGKERKCCLQRHINMLRLCF